MISRGGATSPAGLRLNPERRFYDEV